MTRHSRLEKLLRIELSVENKQNKNMIGKCRSLKLRLIMMQLKNQASLVDLKEVRKSIILLVMY